MSRDPNATDRSDRHDPANPSLARGLGDLIAGHSLRWLALWTIAAAIVAGLAAWLAGETSLVWVAPRKVPMVTVGQKHFGTTADTERAAIVATSARSNAAFGALLGLAFGAAGGMARRSAGGAVKAALLGAIVGGSGGYVASYCLVPVYYRHSHRFVVDLIPSMLLHGALWGSVGALAALALGVGWGAGPSQLVRCLIGGALGAFIGTAAFDLLGAILFASDDTSEPVSTSAASRLFARMLAAVFIALGTLASFGERRPATPRRTDP
jgi:hypothetical protein